MKTLTQTFEEILRKEANNQSAHNIQIEKLIQAVKKRDEEVLGKETIDMEPMDRIDYRMREARYDLRAEIKQKMEQSL